MLTLLPAFYFPQGGDNTQGNKLGMNGANSWFLVFPLTFLKAVCVVVLYVSQCVV